MLLKWYTEGKLNLCVYYKKESFQILPLSFHLKKLQIEALFKVIVSRRKIIKINKQMEKTENNTRQNRGNQNDCEDE